MGLRQARKRSIPRIIAAGALLLGAACAQRGHVEYLNTEQSSCKTGQAEIGINDGFLFRLCGCAEASGATIASPGTLTCTVSSGTTVFFQYLSPRLRHQVISTGSPSFASSPISDPNDDPLFRTHGVLFSTPGTYTFEDAWMPGLTGQIVVL